MSFEAGEDRSATRALYYESPELLDFSATVLSVNRSGSAEIVLDRTAFYPEGGGQPHDTGTLDGVPVTTVRKESGVIYHGVALPPDELHRFEAGDTVAARVDAVRRRTYAQQHTGQHIVSGALLQMAGLNTVSVHQGERFTTIEVDRAAVSAAELAAVEEAANRIIEQNLPVTHRWVTDRDVPGLRLRRPPKVSGSIRIVQIEEWDQVACGGVHMQRTGGVRLVLTAGTEQIRGNTRISYLIGDRAIREAGNALAALSTTGTTLSVPDNAVPERAEQLVAQLAQANSDVERLREKLAAATAERLLARAEERNERTIVVSELEEADASFLRSVTEHLVQSPTACVLLMHTEREPDGSPSRVLWSMGFGRESGTSFTEVRDLLSLIDGKGGGRGEIAQGVGLKPESRQPFLVSFVERVG